MIYDPQASRMDSPVSASASASSSFIPSGTKSQYSVFADDTFNPHLPLDSDEEEVQSQIKVKTKKSKMRTTIFGAVKKFVSSPPPKNSTVNIEPEKPASSAKPSPQKFPQPLFDIDETLNEAQQNVIKHQEMLKKRAEKQQLKTPEEIRQTKELIQNTATKRMPKGMTLQRAKDLYFHNGGDDDYVREMKNVQAVWGKIRDLEV
jgi:hypothetical protein